MVHGKKLCGEVKTAYSVCGGCSGRGWGCFAIPGNAAICYQGVITCMLERIAVGGAYFFDLPVMDNLGHEGSHRGLTAGRPFTSRLYGVILF